MSDTLLVIQTLSGLIGLGNTIRASLEVKKQNGEMTPEEEAAYDAATALEMSQPWWKKSNAGGDTPPLQPPRQPGEPPIEM